jgi:hypothetical protein
MVTILNARRLTRLPELGVQLIKLLDNGGLVSAYRAKMDSAAVMMEQLEAALFVFICSCARLRSLSLQSKLSQRIIEDTVFAMIEAIDDGNRFVTIGECGLSDFEQSQVVIALDTLFGLQIPLIDGDPQSAIERYALKFGELITARVHVGTAALAKTLKAVSEKGVPAGDQWHVALTEISMDINRGLQGCRLTMLATDPSLLNQWHDNAFFGTSLVLLEYVARIHKLI